MHVKKMVRLALLTAVALILFTVEAQIPAPLPIPGVKLGLANIVTVFAAFLLGGKAAALILAARIFLGAVFAGNFSTIFYSASGGALALLTTLALRPILQKKQIWIAGCLGAIAHSLGQMLMALLLNGTPSLLIYLPVLILCSMVTGVFTGLCAQLLLNRGTDLWNTVFK